MRRPSADPTMNAMPRRFSSFRPRLPWKTAAPTVDVSDAPDGIRTPALVVGIANPGAKYGNTRHNVGAWCIALLARKHDANLEQHGRVDRCAIDVDGRTLHLARPRAYVNESGPPVAAETKRLGIAADRVLLVYDDLDLPVGQIRVRSGGGSGGHNGVRSLINSLGGSGFARIRVGIDRPYDDGTPVRDPVRIADWVLSAPGREERERLDEAVARVADAIEVATVEGIDIAMNRFNRSKD